MKILDERVARGEIDTEDYDARQAILRETAYNAGG